MEHYIRQITQSLAKIDQNTVRLLLVLLTLALFVLGAGAPGAGGGIGG